MSEEPLSVYMLLAVSLDQFASVANQKMGLQVDPITGKLDRDLKQAKIAIDVANRLVEAMDPELDEEDRRQVQALLSDLRLNFVRQSSTDANA